MEIGKSAFARVLEFMKAADDKRQKPRFVVLRRRTIAHRQRVKINGRVEIRAIPVTVSYVRDRRLMSKPKYLPHQGKRECARRRRQMGAP